jgi:hypothetical protein
MARSGTGPALVATLGLLVAVPAGAPWAQNAPVTQESPLATAPLPAQGAGQAAMGSAVTGSAPAPGAPSTLDNSQQQDGALLKPGPAAGDMGAAAGARPLGAGEPAKQP